MIIYVLHFSCRRNEMVLKFWLLVRVTALKQYDVLESRSKYSFIVFAFTRRPVSALHGCACVLLPRVHTTT